MLSGQGDINSSDVYISTHYTLPLSRTMMSIHSNNSTTAYTNKHSSRSMIITNNPRHGVIR